MIIFADMNAVLFCLMAAAMGPQDVAAQRAEVWAEWKAENVREQLPPMDSIGVRGYAWVLPDSLEPQAVMPYYFGTKGEAEEYPLFIYLHGSGPKTMEWATGLRLAWMWQDAPSAYFVPQIPNEGQWYRWYQRSKQWAWERLLKRALLNDSIDPERIYLLGIAEGGYGSQRLASFYADYLAAAGPMAGGEPMRNAPAENCSNIGFSLRTGDKDTGFYRNLLSARVGERYDSLQQAHPDLFRHKVELIPDRGHHIDYSPTTPWLSQFRRNASPRHFLWEDFEMDGRRRQGFYNIEVLERSDAYRQQYEVRVHGDTVDVTVQDVEYSPAELDPNWGIELRVNRAYKPSEKGEFILYLGPEHVDLDKPVIVMLNGREVYRGKLKLDKENMRRSARLFSDPLRIYPAALKLKI